MDGAEKMVVWKNDSAYISFGGSGLVRGQIIPSGWVPGIEGLG